MFLSKIEIENFRQFGAGKDSLTVEFQPGVTALVGRNDSGKSAVVDAIRYALLTRDQEYVRVEAEDFHVLPDGSSSTEISIRLKIDGLTSSERGAFAEFLSYDDGDVILNLHWKAQRLSTSDGTRRWVDVTMRSGATGTGPALDAFARQLLAAAYLRPLRDAAREMSPGRSSRLSQILAKVKEIKAGHSFDEKALPVDPDAVGKLSLLGLSDYMRHNVDRHTGIGEAQSTLNEKYLATLSLKGDDLLGRISFSENGSDDTRLRQLLERLELNLLDAESGSSRGKYGLGSNNLLFMACELLLLGNDMESMPLLLIEEPEAHLHPQRQLRLMEFLSASAKRSAQKEGKPVQVILTTHSPNLASKIPLASLVLLDKGSAYSLAPGKTALDRSDYRLLERLLDVTKANLFFSHGVLVVEGDAEAIILPVIAKLLGKDLTEHGVSVVNVSGTGLRRYSKIFQRSLPKSTPIKIPVACLADMDVMPDCAPQILGIIQDDEDEKWKNPKKKWKAVREFGSTAEEQKSSLAERRKRLSGSDGEHVKTFVSDHWTLEYDLARAGLAELVYIAAELAIADDALNAEKKKRAAVIKEARAAYAALREENKDDDDALCSYIYKKFHGRSASKGVAAQHIAELLLRVGPRLSPDQLRELLPEYLVNAIDYVTSPVNRDGT